MAVSEQDRQAILQELGLDPEGEVLGLIAAPQAPAKRTTREQTPVETPDVEQLSDEQLLAPGAFERHKLQASEVGRAVSSPHNKRLYARINDATARLREAEQTHKRTEKAERKKEHRTNVREKVKADTANRAAQGVLEAMRAAGIDLDDLARLLKERGDS